MPGSNASPGLAAGTPAPAATAKKKAPRGASWQISEGIIALYSAIHANQHEEVPDSHSRDQHAAVGQDVDDPP